MSRRQRKIRKRVPGAVEEKGRVRTPPLTLLMKPLLTQKWRRSQPLLRLTLLSCQSLRSLMKQSSKAKVMVTSGFMVIVSEHKDVVAVERLSVMRRKTDLMR